jgi:hypothetical protein
MPGLFSYTGYRLSSVWLSSCIRSVLVSRRLLVFLFSLFAGVWLAFFESCIPHTGMFCAVIVLMTRIAHIAEIAFDSLE